MSNIIFSMYDGKNFSTYFSLNKIDTYIKKILSSHNFLDEPSDFIPKEIKYFTNPLKQNLVKDINFKPDDEVLLINDVFGIIAETLCNKVKNVTIVEFSKTIAEITNARLSDKENVDIYVGEVNNDDINRKFDYLIMNDFFEMEQFHLLEKFSDSGLFKLINNVLKVHGKFIINISNQFGIKNWAGAVEEHFGMAYVSLQNYPKIPVNLLSEEEIKEILEANGFENIKIFYPIPSHYCPKLILSKKDKVERNIAKYYQNYALYSSKPFFDERIVMEDIIDNDKFYLFVNSYMFIAEKGEKVEQT